MKSFKLASLIKLYSFIILLHITQKILSEELNDATESSQPLIDQHNLADDDIIDLDALNDSEIRKEERNSTLIYNDDAVQVPKLLLEDHVLLNEDSATTTKQQPIVDVDEYLTSLSDNELETICKERGFEVKGSAEDGTITHEEYVEAARRCVNLDDEINAVLAKNPDLAAELEAEIDRMKLEKERLEKERDDMLQEKERLEQKLKDSGVYVSDDGNVFIEKSFASNIENIDRDSSTIMSVEEVLAESFRQLFEKVGQDLQVVNMVLRTVLEPISKALSVVWNYSQPTIEVIAQKILLSYIQLSRNEQVQTIVSSIVKPMDLLWTTTCIPVLEKLYHILKPIAISFKEKKVVKSFAMILDPLLTVLNEQLSNTTKLLQTLKNSVSDWVTETLSSNTID